MCRRGGKDLMAEHVEATVEKVPFTKEERHGMQSV